MAPKFVVNIGTGALRPVSQDGTVTRIVEGESLVALVGVTDCRTQRYVNGALRAATAQEIAEYDALQLTYCTAAAQATSRQKDVLATIAWAVRLKDPAAWAAKTIAQKKSAVLAEADNWRDLRVFIEQNL